MRRTYLGLMVVLVLVACSSPSEPTRAWYVGEIVARDIAIPIGAPPTIHVKEDPAEECGIIFLVRPSTRIHLNGIPSSMSASDAYLAVGFEVRVSSGVVFESCPAQAFAEVIDIQ